MKKKTKIPQAPRSKVIPSRSVPPGNQTKADFQHPLLEQARQLAREGKNREAADVLVTLAEQVPPFEKAQILVHASTFSRISDRKRAVDLAQQIGRAHV